MGTNCCHDEYDCSCSAGLSGMQPVCRHARGHVPRWIVSGTFIMKTDRTLRLTNQKQLEVEVL